MYLAFCWCFCLSVSLLASFPGHGPGIREHPDGYVGVVRDRSKHIWRFLKNKYFWYVDDYNEEMYDAMDWTLGFVLHEKSDDVQGLDLQTREELRHKCLTKVAELLVLVIMAAACLTVIRLTLREKFRVQNRKSKSN